MIERVLKNEQSELFNEAAAVSEGGAPRGHAEFFFSNEIFLLKSFHKEKYIENWENFAGLIQFSK